MSFKTYGFDINDTQDFTFNNLRTSCGCGVRRDFKTGQAYFMYFDGTSIEEAKRVHETPIDRGFEVYREIKWMQEGSNNRTHRVDLLAHDARQYMMENGYK